jgi:hypothetical protein
VRRSPNGYSCTQMWCYAVLACGNSASLSYNYAVFMFVFSAHHGDVGTSDLGFSTGCWYRQHPTRPNPLPAISLGIWVQCVVWIRLVLQVIAHASSGLFRDWLTGEAIHDHRPFLLKRGTKYAGPTGAPSPG